MYSQSLSHVQLFATPWTATRQVPLYMGFSRQEYWSGLPCPSQRGSSQPRDQTQVSCIAGRFFTTWATPKKQLCYFKNTMTHWWGLHFWQLQPWAIMNPQKIALTKLIYFTLVFSECNIKIRTLQFFLMDFICSWPDIHPPQASQYYLLTIQIHAVGQLPHQSCIPLNYPPKLSPLLNPNCFSNSTAHKLTYILHAFQSGGC